MRADKPQPDGGVEVSQEFFVADDIYRLEWVDAPFIASDGSRAAFTIRTVNENRDGYRHVVHVADLTTMLTRPFTDGRYEDRAVGATQRDIALLSNRAGATQLFLLPWDGGEARQITWITGGIEEATVSPTGRYLLFTVALRPHERIEDTSSGHADRVGKARDQEPLMRTYEVTHIHYKQDGAPGTHPGGLWGGSYRQMGLLHIESGRVLMVTEGPYDIDSYAFSPDERQIAFTSRRNHDERSQMSDLYIADIASGATSKVTDGRLYLTSPSFSPDGSQVACYGHDDAFGDATHMNIYLIHLRDRVSQALVPRHFPYQIGDECMSDMRGQKRVPGLRWTSDGEFVIAPYSAAGSVSLGIFSQSVPIRPAVAGIRQIYAFDFCPQTGMIVFAASTPGHPGDLRVTYFHDIETEIALTHTNLWLQNRALAKAETYLVHTDDEMPVQAWCMLPPEKAMPEGTVPVILEVHGGPHGMYGYAFFLEFQILASAGYAVLYGNPRGSGGYSQEFTDAVRGDYGGGDFRDLTAMLDQTLDRYPRLDRNRVGVTGGAYGGFMTNWVVGHTDRFKAAVTQHSISNWISFFGVSDIGYEFTEREHGWSSLVTPWSDVQKLWDISPLKYASNVRTPLLILHGEEDHRCPIEQAEQLYVALRRMEKNVSFVRFPKSSHDLSCTGHPDLRAERYRLILGWFLRHV